MNSATKATARDDEEAIPVAFGAFIEPEPEPIKIAAQARSQKADAVVDSGASSHYSPHRDNFLTYTEISREDIYTADGRVVKAVGIGNLKVKLPNRGSYTDAVLKDTYHVPSMTNC